MPDRSPSNEAGQHDSHSSDTSTYKVLSREIQERDRANLDKLYSLQVKERELTKVYSITEDIVLSERADHITPEQYSAYINDEPDLDVMAARLGKMRNKMDEIEDKLFYRTEPGYVLSERSDSPVSDRSDSPVPDTGDISESTEFILPVVFILTTEIPVVSILFVFYKLYKIDFFKILRSYFLY